MKITELFLILIIIFIGVDTHARKIIISNKSQNILEALVIPAGILSLPPKERTRVLKNHFARLNPQKSAQLNFSNFEGIDIKALDPLSTYKFWYKYDKIKTTDLLKILQSSKKNIKMTIYGNGNSYKFKIGKKSIRGTLPFYSIISGL